MASYVRQFAVLVTAVQGKDAKNAVFIGLTSTVESRPNLAAQEAPGRFFSTQNKTNVRFLCTALWDLHTRIVEGFRAFIYLFIRTALLSRVLDNK